jgi:molybdopterin-guanine dinucleotide biosynthesis adapter protein
MRPDTLSIPAPTCASLSPQALRTSGPAAPALFGFVGRSGAGKTTIIAEVIECLRMDGFTVSAIKRAHDGFDLDQPGKDSWRMRQSGCREVMLVGDRRWTLLHEYGGQTEPSPREIALRMADVDIILFEGFRSAPIPMIEVYRPAVGKPMLWPTCPYVIAVATDEAIACSLPVLPLRNPRLACDFLTGHLRLRARAG